MESDLINQIVLTVVGALMTIITATIVPAIKALILKKIEEADAKLVLAEQESGIQIRWAIKTVMRDAVRIAKQASVNGVIKQIGEAKKAYAIDWAKQELEEAGLGYLNVDQIADMIEAAYREVFHELSLTVFPEDGGDYLPES